MPLKGELVSGAAISDAKEFSASTLGAENNANSPYVPCKPPPCRGCRPCTACSCGGGDGAPAEAREKAPVK